MFSYAGPAACRHGGLGIHYTPVINFKGTETLLIHPLPFRTTVISECTFLSEKRMPETSRVSDAQSQSIL